jgi:aspartate aminotransferase
MFEQGRRLKAIHGADKVYDFSLGNPDLDPPGEVLEVLSQEAARTGHMIHSYMPNAGLLEARQAVAESYNRRLGLGLVADDVVMTSGAAGAMNITLKALLEPGDEVIGLVPYFAEYTFYVDNHGGTFVPVPTDAQFLPDLPALEAALTPRTKALIVNSPNNPTGRLYPAAFLMGMAQILSAASARFGHPIYLISDEPYRALVYDGLDCPSPISFYPDTLVASSHSKDLSLAGERIGHLIISPRCTFRAELRQGTIFANRILGFVNANALMQRVVARTAALDLAVDSGLYQRRRDRLSGALGAMGYQFHKPEGAFYLFPRSPLEDETKFCDLLLEELIIAVPGSGFGLPGFFRLSYAVEDAVIEAALPGFERAARRTGLLA